MYKKEKSFQVMFFLAMMVLTSFLSADMLDLYRKKSITLTPDPTFGKNVPWDDLFYDTTLSLLVLPDGTIFASHTTQDKIYKFSPKGELMSTYQQKGLGPSDLNGPKVTSILDDKFIIIWESSLLRRFSIFDLSGKYVKVVKTKNNCKKLVALKNNYIAYSTFKDLSFSKTNKGESQNLIFLKDLTTGKEITVETMDYYSRTMKLNQVSVIMLPNVIGFPCMEQMKNGNLLVGLSSNPILKVFSNTGKPLTPIHLKISPIKVTPDYIRNYRQFQMDDLKATSPKQAYDYFEKALRKNTFEELFEEYLPLYNQFFIDSDGNIIVFKYPNSFDQKTNVIQVYRPDGQFVCETTIHTKGFKLVVSSNVKPIQFTDKGIFAFCVMDSNDDDIHIKLQKLKIE